MEGYVVLIVALSVVILVFLITRLKLNAFIALLCVALGLALALGHTGAEAVSLVLSGFGETMKSSGIIIVLGVIIGYILEKTGGAEKIAASVLRAVGEKRAPLAMCITGSIVSIPVFSDSAFMILHPIIRNLSRKGKLSYMGLCLGTITCLCLTHATVPPTPGPIAAAGLLGADLGKVILGGILVAVPATLAVYLYAAKVIARQYPDWAGEAEETEAAREGESLFKDGAAQPKGYSTLGAYMPIVLPIILIICQSIFSSLLPENHIVNQIFGFIGSPVIALLIGVGIVWVLTREYKTSVRMGWIDAAMDSTALVLLITAAGGAYGSVIKSSDIGAVLSQAISGLGLPGVILPWFISAALVTATGSTTVALTTAAAVCASFLPSLGISPELCVIAIASGGMCVLHVNSSMFWLVQRLCGFEPGATLKTMVPVSAVCSLAALAGAMVLSFVM